MSRYCGDKDATEVLKAAEVWKNRALINGKSVFTENELWTLENLRYLDEYFVQSLDWGEGSFLEKLETQLESCPNPAKALCAEMMWVMLLAPRNVTPSTKKQNINTIMGWSDDVISPSHELLSDEVLSGVGSAGPGYNNFRWMELVYFIRLLSKYYSELQSVREALLTDGDRFTEWCESIEDNDSRQLRHMLLFLLFPDTHERIFGGSHRAKIVSAFT